MILNYRIYWSKKKGSLYMNKELEIELMRMFIRHNAKEIMELDERIVKLQEENSKYQERLDYLEGKN